MIITRDFKIIVLAVLGSLILLAGSILKDNLIMFFAAVCGVILIYFLINNPVRLIYAQILYNLTVKFAVWNLNIPSSFNYFTDVITILIIITAIKKIMDGSEKANLFLPMSVVFIFILATIIGLIINRQSIWLYLWGLRNNFRFYGFFFGCAVLLHKKDIENIFKIIMVFSLINVAFCMVQYFVQGISIDNLGGIFGSAAGVNSYLNIFICMACIITLVRFSSKKVSSLLMLFIVTTSLFIAAIGELKVFFLELLIIAASIALFSKPSKKTIYIVAACALAVFFGIKVFYLLFPYWNDFFSLEKIISTSQSYSSQTDLGRITAASTVTKMFLSDSASKLLLGLGLGSAEASQFAMFTSQFQYQYGATLHYTWFSVAFMLIENGWLGLSCLIGFFITIIYSSMRIKSRNGHLTDYSIMAGTFAIICCILVFYSSVLRTEAAYFIYFMLSLPFSASRDFKESDYINTEVQNAES